MVVDSRQGRVTSLVLFRSDQSQHARITDPPLHQFDQNFVVNRVEVALEIQVDDFVIAEGHPFANVIDRLRSEEHTSELQSQSNLVCRLLLEKKKTHEVS